MSDAIAVLLVQLVIYGPFLTWMICHMFHRKTMDKLHAEHRAELQQERDDRRAEREARYAEERGRVEEQRARNQASRGDAYSSLSLSLVSSVTPGVRTVEEARLVGTVQGMRDRMIEIEKRLSNLEDERKNGQEGAA